MYCGSNATDSYDLVLTNLLPEIVGFLKIAGEIRKLVRKGSQKNN